jgi:hypothetical protein
MDPKVCRGGELSKLLDAFVKEANRNPVESALVLPTKAEVETAARHTFWLQRCLQFNHRWDFVGTRIRHTGKNPDDFHAKWHDDWTVDGCIKPEFEALVEANLRRIRAIQLNRAIFFRDPVTWIFETGVNRSTGLPDYNIPISMDDPAAAQILILDLETRLNEARLIRPPDHDNYNYRTWDDVDPIVRRNLKRSMRVQDVPGPVVEALREKMMAGFKCHTSRAYESGLLETPSFETQDPSFETQDKTLVTQSDESGAQSKVRRLAIRHNTVPQFAIKPGTETTPSPGPDDTTNASHPLSSGEKVLSPIVFGAKRSLSKALKREARVSNSLKKKKHQNQKQTSLHDYIDGKETPATKNVDGKSDASPNDDTDEMSVSDCAYHGDKGDDGDEDDDDKTAERSASSAN